MYQKAITEEIVHDWARGASAEETKEHLRNKYTINIGLATIYRHRHSLTAQDLIDELIRQQERAILKADTDNPEIAMRYRNELLKILLPTRIEALTSNNRNGNDRHIILEMWRPTIDNTGDKTSAST